MGNGAGCRRVCCVRNIKEWGQFLLLNLWLTLWAVFVLHSHCQWNGKCVCVLQECQDVAEVFGEQLGWDFSLVGAFCNVNIEQKKSTWWESALDLFVLLLDLFPKSDPWVLLKERCSFCQNKVMFLVPRSRQLCRQENSRDKKVATYRTLLIHSGSRGLAKTHCPPISVTSSECTGKM